MCHMLVTCSEACSALRGYVHTYRTEVICALAQSELICVHKFPQALASAVCNPVTSETAGCFV